LPTWHAKLTRPEQTLDDYLSPENRQFRLSTNWANEADKRADKIEYIELLGPSGTRHVIKPQKTAFVGLPFATCQSDLSYRLHGDREFEWGTVRIENGTVTLPSAGDTAVVATLGVQAGGGVMIDLDSGTGRPYAHAEVSVRLRPKRWGESDWPTFLRRLDYEVALAYFFGTEPYRPLHTADNSEDQTLSSVLYNRFALSAYGLYPVLDAVSVGLGVGGGVGYALLEGDYERVGRWRAFALPSIRVRYDLSQRVSIVVTARALTPDRFYRYESSNDFKGSPRASTELLTWGFLDAGLQVWL
ncbi:MAG: hypothetical protein PHU25_22125, partial [Deltaproteobacteria bacterium]|nr:hypothetical protein [Deltaproteobacteria bacterium]